MTARCVRDARDDVKPRDTLDARIARLDGALWDEHVQRDGPPPDNDALLRE